jgi:CubicO group peptidase (beta-lactamase class C family)
VPASVAVLCVAAILIPACAVAPHHRADGSGAIVREEVRPMRDGLAPLIRSAQARFSVPGLTVVLVRGNQTLWEEGFGFADVTNRVPATPGTIFRAGSLAKPFTAIAVMQLAEAGQINIDRPLHAYLPELSIRSRFQPAAGPITVRSVLDHHSGLPTDLLKGMWSDQPFTAVAGKLAEEYAAFPPNLVFSYSNVGYTLLGHMVQEVSGIPYRQYMRERIFQPVGMDSTGFISDRETGEQYAKGYRGGKEVELLPMRDLPALGLTTTAADLGRFMRALLSPQGGAGERMLLRPATLREMFEPQNLRVALDLDVVNGLGWFLEDGSIPGAGLVARQGGTLRAFSADLILLPEKHLGVAVLANAENSRGIVSKLAEQILKSMLATKGAPPPHALFRAALEKKQAIGGPAALAGNYATDFGMISIRPKDAKVCACIVEKTFDLIPYPNDWFSLKERGFGALPSAIAPLAHMQFRTREIGGRQVVVAKHGGKETVVGERIPPGPVPKVWLERVGRYQLLNPDPEFPLTDPQLRLRDGQLYMSYKLPRLSPMTIQVPMRAISDTEAIILGLGRTRGETLRAIKVNGEERLRYSGFIGQQLKQGQDEP